MRESLKQLHLQDNEHTYSISVSYLEIYNETGYDLLDGERDFKRLEDMPYVFKFSNLLNICSNRRY